MANPMRCAIACFCDGCGVLIARTEIEYKNKWSVGKLRELVEETKAMFVGEKTFCNNCIGGEEFEKAVKDLMEKENEMSVGDIKGSRRRFKDKMKRGEGPARKGRSVAEGIAAEKRKALRMASTQGKKK